MKTLPLLLLFGLAVTSAAFGQYPVTCFQSQNYSRLASQRTSYGWIPQNGETSSLGSNGLTQTLSSFYQSTGSTNTVYFYEYYCTPFGDSRFGGYMHFVLTNHYKVESYGDRRASLYTTNQLAVGSAPANRRNLSGLYGFAGTVAYTAGVTKNFESGTVAFALNNADPTYNYATVFYTNWKDSSGNPVSFYVKCPAGKFGFNYTLTYADAKKRAVAKNPTPDWVFAMPLSRIGPVP